MGSLNWDQIIKKTNSFQISRKVRIGWSRWNSQFPCLKSKSNSVICVKLQVTGNYSRGFVESVALDFNINCILPQHISLKTDGSHWNTASVFCFFFFYIYVGRTVFSDCYLSAIVPFQLFISKSSLYSIMKSYRTTLHRSSVECVLHHQLKWGSLAEVWNTFLLNGVIVLHTLFHANCDVWVLGGKNTP